MTRKWLLFLTLLCVFLIPAAFSEEIVVETGLQETVANATLPDRAVTITVKNGSVPTKMYDGTRNVTTKSLEPSDIITDYKFTTADLVINNVASGDTVKITRFAAAYDNSDVGSAHTVTITIKEIQSDSTRYNYVLGTTTLTIQGCIITPRDLLITPKPGISKYYGESDPSFTASVSGMLQKDLDSGTKISGALSRASGEAVGTYKYNAGTLSCNNSNYAIVVSDAAFTISPKPIGSAGVEVSISNQQYTGSALKPPVTLTYLGRPLVQGTDYTVGAYSNNVNVGTASVALTGKGNFTGTMNAYFHILNTAEIDIASIFPDRAFRTLVSDYDMDENGALDELEINDITTIYAYNESISSLQGIEYLFNLKELDCSNNALTSLDLSRNHLLTELNCENNSLRTLNVSGCFLLTDINCANNQITSLDVSESPLLKELDCSNNAIKTLNISRNPELEFLNASANAFTTLDVSGAKEIRAFVFDDYRTNVGGVVCYGEIITEDGITELLYGLCVNSNVTIKVGNNFNPNSVLKLPEGLTEIRAEAFAGNSACIVVIPESVKTIGSRAFADCKNLVRVIFTTVPEHVASNAFAGCDNLRDDVWY